MIKPIEDWVETSPEAAGVIRKLRAENERLQTRIDTLERKLIAEDWDAAKARLSEIVNDAVQYDLAAGEVEVIIRVRRAAKGPV
jgi:hypothetical protein